MIGLIPPELGLLSSLQQLELQNNALTGVIPREIGGLGNLRYLGLNDNQLLGKRGGRAVGTPLCVLSYYSYNPWKS